MIYVYLHFYIDCMSNGPLIKVGVTEVPNQCSAVIISKCRATLEQLYCVRIAHARRAERLTLAEVATAICARLTDVAAHQRQTDHMRRTQTSH